VFELKIPHWTDKRSKVGSGKKIEVSFRPTSENSITHQEPPDLFNTGDAPDLPPRPQTNRPSPPPTSQSPDASVAEQARIIKEYEEQQAALVAKREAEERSRLEQQMSQQREFEELQKQQAERERQAAEALQMQQINLQNNQAAARANELEREILGMRGQYERDQLLLQQYDMVCCDERLSISSDIFL
jgi:huntingtin-interacting protein 1-related protein